MTDAPDPRDERNEQDDQDERPDPDQPGRASRTTRSDRSAGATGGAPGRPGRTSGGGRRRSAPATTDPDTTPSRTAGRRTRTGDAEKTEATRRTGDTGRASRQRTGSTRSTGTPGTTRRSTADRPAGAGQRTRTTEPTEPGRRTHRTQPTGPAGASRRARTTEPTGTTEPGDPSGQTPRTQAASAAGVGRRAGGTEPTGPSGRIRRAQAARPPTGHSTRTTRQASITEPPSGTELAGTGDPAESYLAAYLDAVERGDEPPDLDGLDPGARADVEAVLALLAGGGTVGAGPGEGGARAGAPPRQAGSGTGGTGGTGGPTATTGGSPDDPGPGDQPELRPLGESEFAVEHGLSRTNPDVVVSGPAVHQARAVAGMTAVDVAEEMARRGYAIEAEAVEAVERRTAYRMHPRDARLLAAVLDLPLDTIEATAAPWPADPENLAELAGAGAGDTASAVRPIVLGDDVVLRTETGSHLGVLRCAGGADVLDSRTYREAAASKLNGPWSHLAGALLVADEPPHLALAVDALDCVARQHAPSGLTGFSRLAEPETIAAALASYDRAYAIDWSDPDPLEGLATRPDQAARALAGRIEAVADRLADEARRSRQPGKRPGYTAAAKWLRATPAADVVALLDELAHADPDEARRRLDELTEVVPA